MGIEDRDYYREEYAKKNGMHYDPSRATYGRANEGNIGKGLGASYPSSDYSHELRFWTKLIAFAVLVAVIILCFRAYTVYKAQKQLAAVMAQAAADLQKHQEELRQSVARQSLEVERKRQADQERILQFRRNREAEEKARREEIELAAERAAAWGRYYKPSPACQRDSVSVDCANEHIRARRAFDAQYKN